MNKIKNLLVAVLLMSLCACGITKKDLGFTREGPDETKVETRKSLILPPEYNVRPQNADFNKTDEEAEED